MSPNYPIHDLYIRELTYVDDDRLQQLPLLRFDDHILRRFGYAEFIRVPGGGKMDMAGRERADEVWALVEGAVSFLWKDERENSPTFHCEHRLTSDGPLVVLVPFGVSFSFQADENGALLVRFATDEPDGSKEFPFSLPELSQ